MPRYPQLIFLRPLLFAWLALALLVSLSGCGEEDTPASAPEAISIAWQMTLPNLVFQSGTFQPLQVKVLGLSPQDVDSVMAQLLDANANPVGQFHLYDDGGGYQHDDGLAFCSPWSYDNVPLDGQYSRLLNSLFTPLEGYFSINVTAWFQADSVTTSFDTVGVFNNLPPIVTILNSPDTLASGFASIQILVQATNPDPLIDSVVTVEMKLYASGNQLIGNPWQMTPAGGNNFQLLVSSDFAIGLSSAPYLFVFRAKDTFNVWSDSVSQPTFIENLAPYLGETDFPDTMALPDSFMTVPISIQVWDDQTNADLSQVYLLSRKPDGTMANNGNPIPMVDNGLPFDPALWEQGYLGDPTAGDSLFTTTAVLYDTSQTGYYLFTFKAVDLAGNESSALLDSMLVNP